jgi:small subunit ribosomal protein S9
MPQTTIEKPYGTGRRKCAVARVRLSDGTGRILINGRPIDQYLCRFTSRASVLQPLLVAELEQKLDVAINVRGGGETGQAEAASHGISRALLELDGELRPRLKRAGFLTRDARIKERKKYGQPGARKKFQYSKR